MVDGIQPACSAVIVNYHSEGLLSQCLASLEAEEEVLEVIAVDNSATLAESTVPRRFPWLRIVENRHNLGFARASNQGLQKARGRYLLLLNPDTVVHPGALHALMRYLDRHPEVGAVGPKVLDPDGSLQLSCRRFPGYLTIFFGRYSALTRWLPRNPFSRRYLYLDWDHGSAAEVDWLSGACLMVRREVLEQVGPLDEEYFLFVEDMDWCRRIRDAGWSVAYVPSAVVTHRIGASRGPQPARLVWERHRGMLRYFHKHFRKPWPLEALVGAGLLLRAGVLVLSHGLRGLR
jgi:GT2 family glycosyltransferase